MLLILVYKGAGVACMYEWKIYYRLERLVWYFYEQSLLKLLLDVGVGVCDSVCLTLPVNVGCSMFVV